MAEKESTAYLMEWFTRELARRFSDELALTVKNGIADVQDSQIDSLDMMDGQKVAFYKVRDALIQTHRAAERNGRVSGWLRDLRAHCK